MTNDETKETPNDDSDTTSKDANPADTINKSYEELKAANDKVDAELLRGEELRARKAQGGKSAAGSEVKEQTQDEKDEETAKDFMRDDE